MKRIIRLNKQAMKVVEETHRRFVEKFGREPEGNDPVFFDPDFDTPTPYTEAKLRRIVSEAALKAGVDVRRALLQFRFEVE